MNGSRPILFVLVLCLLLMLGGFFSYLALRLQAVHEFLERIETNQARIFRMIDRNNTHLEVQDEHLAKQDQIIEEIHRVIVGGR